MSSWLKISHGNHTLRWREHKHTSYFPLFLLLLTVGMILAVCTVYAATPYNGPEAASIGIKGTMPGKPPTSGATITSPTNGQRFSQTPVTVKGTCPKGLLVEIFKNDIFAGSQTCKDDGTFSVEVDLLFGENRLTAIVYDALNQAGPTSNVVTVFYDALPAQMAGLSGLSFAGTQMLLNTDAVYRGTFPNQEMVAPLTIIGGVPPYAVNIQWGDSTNKLVPRSDNLTFNVNHTYKKAGIYQVTFQATDSQGRVAFLTVVAIINGQPPSVAGATDDKPDTRNLWWLWILLICMIAIALAFWLGERREEHLLRRSMPVMPTNV